MSAGGLLGAVILLVCAATCDAKGGSSWGGGYSRGGIRHYGHSDISGWTVLGVLATIVMIAAGCYVLTRRWWLGPPRRWTHQPPAPDAAAGGGTVAVVGNQPLVNTCGPNYRKRAGSLRRLPYGVAGVQHVDVGGNDLRGSLADCNIRDPVTRAGGLVSLHVDDNDLTGLAGIGAAPHLQLLNAAGNDIADLGHSGDSCGELLWFDVCNNRLRSLDGLQRLAPNLQVLLAVHNDLCEIPSEVWAGLSASLRILDLADNDLTRVPGLEQLRVLEECNLANNSLAYEAKEDLLAVVRCSERGLILNITDALPRKHTPEIAGALREANPACRIVTTWGDSHELEMNVRWGATIPVWVANAVTISTERWTAQDTYGLLACLVAVAAARMAAANPGAWWPLLALLLILAAFSSKVLTKRTERVPTPGGAAGHQQ